MAVDDLIDYHVSSRQCDTAVKALLKHALKISKANEEKELIPGKEENIWLVLSVKKTTPEKKLKPHKIPLAHPIVDPRESPICLITKDPQREYKDLLAQHNVKFINRVVGIEKLKGKFKPFEARRMLMRENGLFLADERVVPLLPKLLGKIFFEAKKQPLPVNLTRKDVKAELEKAVSSTYLHQNQGTCTSVRIGKISQSREIILDNLKVALPAIAKRIEGGWANVQSLHIKTNSSISLPIWTCALGEGAEARWATSNSEEATVVGWSGFGEEGEGGNESDEPDNKKPRDSDVKKGKKRMADGESKAPSKKAKKADMEGGKKAVEQKTSKSKKGKEPSPVPEAAEPDEDIDIPAKPTKSVKFAKSANKKPSLKAEEIKQKRSSVGIEKKKEKVVKRKSGGSVKESLVGKKAKSRI